VYLLLNGRGRTYVGSTTRPPDRRLREHNGERAGGAAQTASGRPWTLARVVRGFRTRREALQFEFAWRRVHRRVRAAYSLPGRCASLAHLLAQERWSSRAPAASDVPLRVDVVE